MFAAVADVPNVNPVVVVAAGVLWPNRERPLDCGCAGVADDPKLNPVCCVCPPPKPVDALPPKLKEGACVVVAAVEPNVNPCVVVDAGVLPKENPLEPPNILSFSV